MMLNQLRAVFQYRDAIRNLAIRDLRVRYSNATLGILWSLLNPLLLTVVFSFVFTVLMPNGIEKYPVFFLAGQLPWGFFSLSLSFTTTAISQNPHLINRVYFPREILPIAIVLANALAFIIALLPLTALMVFFQVPFTPALLWVPLLLSLQILLSIGLGLILSALNVFLRDTQQIVEVLILPLFFITPIFYSADTIVNPTLRFLALALNPIASLITAYRQAIFYGAAPDLQMLGLTTATIIGLLLIGIVIFRRLSPHFADEL